MSSTRLQDYHYDLPTERIALYPLPERDQSKLLVYKNGEINHRIFTDLPQELPTDSFLVFNNTRVIPARLHFQRATGGMIEIFLLNPVHPSTSIPLAMEAVGSATWKCTIGNLKKFNEPLVRWIGNTEFKAELMDRAELLVTFTWNGDKSFAELIHEAGNTPLPPYLKREAEASDKLRYQTIYSANDGAVAAPTAGLHFTEQVFQRLQERHIGHDFVTLHVGAGTFMPVKTDDITAHQMHEEQLIVTRQNIENLVRHRVIIPVGTTSMRTLESVYWFGVKLQTHDQQHFAIDQEQAYAGEVSLTKEEALNNVLQWMERRQINSLTGQTSIFIRPGYKFRVCNGLITNFHQPESTLIMLIASLVGKKWRTIYEEALRHEYRFLSYGDSSLLLP